MDDGCPLGHISVRGGSGRWLVLGEEIGESWR